MPFPHGLDLSRLGAADALLPRFAPVRQRFHDDALPDAAAAVRRALDASGIAVRVKAGGRIAITGGSRGIDRIAEVTRAVAQWVRDAGGEPFVVAAMGSHGGATAEGQREVLRGYGIDEAGVGCAVVSSMEATEIGVTAGGYRVYCDAAALASDGVIAVNRVKPHTILVGELGSGLMKMLGVGLGKQLGADAIHREGLQEHMLDSARIVLGRAPVLGGVALVENSYDKLAIVEAVPPETMEDADSRLLRVARAYLPNVPFDPLDVLVVARMGKDVSGAGIDPNVAGMHRRLGGPPQRAIGRIVALELTAGSHGNGIGVGMADIVTERLRDAIDWEATYVNAATSGFLWGVKVPLALPTDEAALRLAFKPYPPQRARAVLARDTAHLDLLYVSEALEAEVAAMAPVERIGEYEALGFGADGRLLAFE